MANILGINAYHGDSSASLIVDGELVAAVEEERFRRIKHWAGFPSKSIEYCLRAPGLKISDIDFVVINSDPKANLFKKVSFMVKKRPDMKLVLDRIKNRKERVSVADELKKAFPGEKIKCEVRYVEHHLAHMASCYLVSPYNNAITVSIDGFGDFSSAAWGVGSGADIKVEGKVSFPHSMGIFYQAMTQYLGFPHYGDEYKVMGLAPYGEPKYMGQMRQIVKLHDDGSYSLNLEYFRHHKEKIEYEWENGSPHVGELFTDALIGLLGPKRNKEDALEQKHKDIARSIQLMYEEAFFHLLNTLHKKHKIDDLTLAGGCAMNSVANGKIRRNTPFKNVYIQSAAGDAGGAIGAALIVARDIGDIQSTSHMDHAYWGPEFSNDEIKSVLDENSEDIKEKNCTVEYISDEKELCRRTAENIAEAQVVGWFQGRLEWGPRALGNRSIVCDPRRGDMKDILNLKIKRRESFRPFAPSILREEVNQWFEEDDDVPFMMKVFQIKEEKRHKIPAVTHFDGSGRLQTVYEKTNPRYHLLISSFGEITGVPIVLNTSFNENEPVVCHPKEALDCFLRTNMDVLVVGNYLITRLRNI
ncbi:MAG: carbamoyltransferase [Gammaproteobacteria bacterium]|nr:carbamoyltransferase [Gammaproteobacteria bacterium]MDH5799270.1 carbamoyltransferase [Gammaproteobacteria bacterium]